MAISSSTINPDPDGVGSAFQIGDGIWLSVGHNFFRIPESRYEQDPAKRQLSHITVSNNFTIVKDDEWRKFEENLFDEYRNHIHDPNISIAQNIAQIFGRAVPDDWVLFEKGGSLSASSPGLMMFLDSSDLYNSDYKLNSTGDDVFVSRDGAVSSVNDAAIAQSITFTDLTDGKVKTASESGRFWHDSTSDLSSFGDSGTAVHVEFKNGALQLGDRAFVLGSVVSIRAEAQKLNSQTGQKAFFGRPSAHYFNANDFRVVNKILEEHSRDLENVTKLEPTNLIVGSISNETADGTYRADIILGRGGEDKINDGDGSGDKVWANDQLFGGADNDEFQAGNGDDLIHGGDFRQYGGNARIAIEDDGKDSVDYSGLLARDAKIDGLELRIGKKANEQEPQWVYGDETDKDLAIYMLDRKQQDTQYDKKLKLGVDALISIETVTLSANDDLLSLNEFATNRFAGSDEKGGLFAVKFGGNREVDGTKENVGDLIDAGTLTTDMLIDLAAMKIVAKADQSASSPSNILKIEGAESAYGGEGDDIIRGDGGKNRLRGGKGADTVEGAGGDDWIVSDADDEIDTYNGGDGTDTIVYKYEGSGTITLGSSNGSGGFGLSISVSGGPSFGADNLVSIEKASVEAGDAVDILNVSAEGAAILAASLDFIDLGGGAAEDVIDVSGWLTTGAEIVLGTEGRLGWGGASIRVLGAERGIGGGGSDIVSVVNALGTGQANAYTLIGGGGSDTLTGGSGNDSLYGNSNAQNGAEDDSVGDTLRGGGGVDTFYVGTGDVIIDPQLGESIYLRGKKLTGGKQKDPKKREYISDDLGTFRLAADGTLTFSINPTITIQNFRNGLASIRLIDAKDEDDDGDDDYGRPDFDPAERLHDPLIIDLNGDRNVVTARNSVAAYFDIDNDGFSERVSWARAGDGFLVRDLDGNGLIETGSELFGTGAVDSSAAQLQPFGKDGFAELALLDSNFDGAITAADTLFSQLRVWIDANLDARTDAGELVTLESLGIVSISLSTFDSDHIAITNDASVITRASTVGFANGSTRTIYDAYLSVDQFDARELAGDVTIDERIADLPFLLGSGNVSDLDIAMSRDAGLAELVREFSELGIDKAHEILARAQQILLRWTGADQVAPDSRGPNINAQWLHALEAITGEDFVQSGSIGSDPRGDAAGVLIGQWQSLVTRTAARLVGQIPLGDALTPGLSFEAAAFFTVADGTTLDSILTSAAANQPTNKSESIGYWAALVEILGMYRDFLPIEAGVTGGPLVEEFDARLGAALTEAGIPFSLGDLRRVLTVSSGEDKVIGRTRGAPTSPNDLIIIQGDAGRVDGASGDDIYVVGRNVGALDIVDARGNNELFLSDFLASDITVVAVVEDGRSWLRFSDASGTLNMRVRVDVDADSIGTAVQSVRFGDGTTSSILELIEGGGAALGVIFAADGSDPVAGTAADDLIVGVGANNSYNFARGAGSDTIFDLSGEGDRIIVAGNVSDIEFTVGRTDDGDDLILRFRDTGDSLRVAGHRSDRGREIELFEFADATLTLAQVDSILNSGSPSDDIIVGSRRDDLISGFAGDDILQGMGGRDTYFFDLGWGQDRIVEADSANAIVFGASVRVADITAERGNNGDLVLRSSAGDRITIVGGLRSPIVTSFAFGDGTTKTLTDIVDQLLAGGTNTISGTAVDEELIGTAESETFVGNGGNDTFRGFGGVDFYRIDAPFTRVFGSAAGIDTLIAPTGAALADLRFDDDRHVFVFGRNGPVAYADSELDYVRFSDGALVDLTGPGISLGTAGNDFLYSTGRAPTTFRSGAGNDVIIGSAKESALDTYEFEVGFGNDTIYDLGGQADRITFLSPELSVANATFQKIGSNLVIAFSSGDRLTIEGHFWNYSYDNGIPDFLGQDSGGIEFFTFGDAQSFAGVNSFLSSVTAGDDLVMSGSFAGLRDGGAGNDILFGGREANTYIFRAGYGHDIIKDDGGNNQSVRFFGLEPDDVVITRDPSDPFSIVFTIAATGETLTIDGSPDDGFQPDRDPRAALNERGLNIQQFVFGSVTLTAGDILDRVFAAEGTDGDNVIWGINSDRDIRPGLGNDVIHIGNGQERVVIGPNSGSKIITFEPDGSRPGSGPLPFAVLFEGMSLEDLVLVEVNEANGQVGKHLQIIAGETVVTILNGLDPRFNQASQGEGAVPRFSIQSDDSQLEFRQEDIAAPLSIPLGPVSTLIQGTDGVDFLRAPRSFDGTPLPPQVIDPLAGDDMIFGSSAGETVRFDVGYGVDRYEWAGGLLTVEVGEGLSRDDINISWSKTEPGLVEIGINGTSDKLIFDARALAKIRVGGETLTTGAYPDSDVSSLPASSVEPDQQLRSGSGDERIVATGGSATIVIAPTSGSDYLEDARLDAAAGGIDGLDGWSPNTLVIDEIGSVDQLRFIVENGRPNDLIIEKPNGERITILNQFAFGVPNVAPPLRSPDADGDGAADWANIDLNGDGAPDFAALDPDGDGTPGWLTVDLNNDGANDWTTYATASASFDGGEVYAEDYDLDGNFEYYSFYTDDLFFAARDVDFDGVADEYSEDGLVWTPAPQDAAGNVEWSLLDINGNGVSDLGGFDAQGGPTWLSAFNPQTGATGWSVRGFGELYDADGAFVAERQFDLATGASTYLVYGDGASGDNTTFIAQDIEGDGQPDLVGADFTGDLVADPIADNSVPVVVGRIVLRQSTPPFFTERQVPLGTVISRIEFVASPPVSVLSLADYRDPATAGADHLLLGTGEEIDSLAGDDVVTSFGDGGVFRWSTGAGNDLFKSTLRIPGGDNGAGPATTALDTIRFDGILDPVQLRFLASSTNPANLIVEIIATGERLTIEGQLGALDGAQRAAPPVARFVFESGLVLSAGEVATRLRDPVVADGTNTQTTNNDGGLLDAGVNANDQAVDQLRGGSGNDIYRFGRDYGEDLVLDAGGLDAVQFGSGITRDELFFSRTGEGGKDLLIEVLGADRLALTIVNQFASESNRIESFVFDDGRRLAWQAVQQIILDIAETNSDDDVRGFLTDDIIRGGRGNDVLTGGGGNDQIFGGEGRDRAIFTGGQDEYEISTDGEITIVTDTVGNRDGVTRLTSVEDLQFRADGAMTPIAPVNAAPVVNDVVLDGDEDATLLIGAATLLAAASDANGDTVRIASVGAASKGKVWIGIDGNVRFLPDIDFAGEAGFDFVISDGNGGLTTARALVSVRGSNDAPRITIEGRTFTTFEDRPINWILPTGSISDPDGDSLVVEARLSSGEPLPGWLTFADNRFTGTPPSDFNGAFDIELVAADGAASSRTLLRLDILPINDAPRLAITPPEVAIQRGQEFSFTLPASTFVDPESDEIAYQIALGDGSALPSWIAVNGLEISGTAPADLVGPLELALIASDGSATSVVTFSLVPNSNSAPAVAAPIADATSQEDSAFRFTLPTGTFIDADGDVLSLTASLANGSALPDWLGFDGITFTGTPPSDFSGELDVLVAASDGQASISDTFRLSILPVNDAPRAIALSAQTIAENAAPGALVGTLSVDDPDLGDLHSFEIVATQLRLDQALLLDPAAPIALAYTGPDAGANNTGLLLTSMGRYLGQEGQGDFTVWRLRNSNDTPRTVRLNASAGGFDKTVVLQPDTDTFVLSPITDGSSTHRLYLGTTLIDTKAASSSVFSFSTQVSVANPMFALDGNRLVVAPGADLDFERMSLVAVAVRATDSQGAQVVQSLTIAISNVSDFNVISGTDAANTLTGTAFADELRGLGGNDRLTGRGGNDLLMGGTGSDTALFAGLRATYAVITANGTVTVRDTSAAADGDDGTDTIASIELLSFKNGETASVVSPIILDLDGNGIETLSASRSNARFDLDGDGLADDTSWISADDAFLYLDRDGNGTMSGVEEISFVDDVPNARTDLAGLAAFDSNNDRVLDARDARFADFAVWRDADGDGAVDEGETARLAAVGIRSINLVGTPVNNTTEFGEVAIANTGSFTLTNGTTRSFADAALTYFSAATNLPSLGVTQYDFDRKASKFRISAAGGALTVGSRNARSSVDPLAGQLGANTILTFRDGDYGMFAPVVLDLDGDGVELVSRKKSRAVFDYAGDGAADDTGWIGRDDGFLVIDRNNDGLITEAAELSLASEDEEARSGLQGLARLDSNSDGVVDRADARSGELRVWRDGNGNGRTDAGELLTLGQAGVIAIRLNAVTPTQQSMKLDRNVIAATASFVRVNGTTSTVADVSLAYRPVSAPTAPVAGFDLSERFAGFGPDLFLTPREIERQSRFDLLSSVNELAAMLGRADAEAVSDIFDRVSAAATTAQVAMAQQVTIAPQETGAVPRPPRVFDPSSLYFAIYDSIGLNAWRGGMGEPAEVGVLAVAPFEAGQVAYNESGNPDPVLNGAASDEPTPVAGEPRRLLDRSAHELWGGPAWIGSLPVSEASAEATPPSIAVASAPLSNSPVSSDDTWPPEAAANEEAAVTPPIMGQADHPRLDPAQHELWGGPLNISLFESSPETEEAGAIIRATAFGAMHGLADVEIARKLAMIRQDLSTFGAAGVGEVERLRQLPAQAMDIFA